MIAYNLVLGTTGGVKMNHRDINCRLYLKARPMRAGSPAWPPLKWSCLAVVFKSHNR